MSKPTQRNRLRWRETDSVVSSNNEHIYWNVDTFFLDLLICRGRDIGLSALLPNLPLHHAIEFSFELDWSPRTFSAKFAHLEFDPIGAMQYIGKTHRAEDAWIAWIPVEAVGPQLHEQEPIAPGTCSGDTRISKRHHRAAVMYFASEFEQMSHRDITIYEPYPDLDDDDDIGRATNIWYVMNSLKFDRQSIYVEWRYT